MARISCKPNGAGLIGLRSKRSFLQAFAGNANLHASCLDGRAVPGLPVRVQRQLVGIVLARAYLHE